MAHMSQNPQTMLRHFIYEYEHAGDKPKSPNSSSVSRNASDPVSPTTTSPGKNSLPVFPLSPVPHSNSTITSNDEDSAFAKLPTELCQQVIGYLDVPEILHLRLMSRSFADLCAPELFKTGFSLRPQRDDMIRLARACLIPEIARGIKCLNIYMGDMSMDHFLSGINDARYVAIPDKPMMRITKLFDPTTLHCNKEMLEAIFSQLSNLSSISAMSQTSPFWQVYEDVRPTPAKERTRMHFEAVWDHMEDSSSDFDRNHFLNSKVSVERYTTVLLSSMHLPSPLQTLELDAFPIDCFSEDLNHFVAHDSHEEPKDVNVDMRLFGQLKKAVAGVQKLEIGLIGSGDPVTLYSGPKLGQALGKFIGSMKHLRSLTLDWMIEEDVDESFAIAWDKTFFQLHFEHLEELRFSNVESPREVVASFILKHASSMKRLSWSIPGIDEEEFFPTGEETEPRPWRAIFTDFKDQLTKLECCELLNDSDWGNLYFKNWEPEPASAYKNVPSSKLLELFVLGKVPWPMKKDNPHHYRGWTPKHSVNYEIFLAYTEEELADIYSEEWETDKESSDSSMDSDDDDEDDDDDDDDDDDMTDEDDMEIGSMDLDGDGDEWEDDNSHVEMPWDTLPPELLMAALAYDFEEGMQE